MPCAITGARVLGRQFPWPLSENSWQQLGSALGSRTPGPSHLGFIFSCAALCKEAVQDWVGCSTKSTGTKGLPSFYITNFTAQQSSSKPPHGPRWLLEVQLSCLNSRQQDRERGKGQSMHHSYEVCSEKPYPTYLPLSHWPNFSHMATCNCKGSWEIWCFPLRHTGQGSVTKT